jgi:hypothetical protein
MSQGPVPPDRRGAAERAHDVGRESLTRADLTDHARRVWEEAYAADPWHTEEVTMKIVGRDVFAWDNLTLLQIKTLSRALFPLVMMARG